MGIRRDSAPRLLLAAAVLLLLAALAAGGTTAWTWLGRTRDIHAAQQRLSRGLEAQWASGAAPPARPAPIARLHLPTLRLDLVVVGGSAEADLRQGPGLIPGTAPIGAAGNTGIAGGRYPGVFWELDRVGIGDPVVLETREAWLVYRVIEARVVRPDDDALLEPPPPGAGPRLTLVTGDPRLSAARRLVRQATLVRRDPHAGPRPAELA
ncbi:sortase [Dactylosporangium sp. CA-139066]|uniref:sortase n=1 Tax=Dactylosporangium sp. CA-139066 TaxID=3239930 RepID=UPI003D8EB447